MHLKGFSTTNFLMSFDRLQRAGDTVPGQSHWTAFDFNWTRGRHTYYGTEYSTTLDVVHVASAGKKPWTLMMVRESWWLEDSADPIKTRQWAHFVKGDRAQALEDFAQLFEALP